MTNTYSAQPPKILVLGAGELGIEILRQLAIQGVETAKAQVSVLLREPTVTSTSPDKVALIAELKTLGIEVVSGDVINASIEQLAGIFKGFDTVVSCVGFAAGPGTQIKLVKAAIESGVARYFPWQFGVDYDVIGRGSAQPLFDEQLEVRDRLRAQQRMNWVIVSTGMFTSFLFEPSFGVVDLANHAVNALGSLDTRVTVTTPQDIGRLTAKLVLTFGEIDNQVVYTAGDTLSYGQLADLLESVLGTAISRRAWTVPFLKSELQDAADDMIRKYRLVFAQGNDNGDGVAWDKSATYNARQGIAVTSVEDWIRQNLL